MRKHEIELIAALAEGTLEDETEARALVGSSSKARAEYEAQKTALDALASIPPVALTDVEKAALHRDIWTALKAQPVAAKKTPPWYYRWSYVAAGLFVVIGLVTVLNIGASSGDDASLERVESAQDSATETTSAADEADQGLEAPSIANDDASADDSISGDPIVGFFRREASKVRSGQFATASASEGDEQQSVLDEQEKCLLRADLEGYQSVGEVSFAEAEEFGLDPDTSYLVAVPTAVLLDDSTPVAFVELPSCTQVYLDK